VRQTAEIRKLHHPSLESQLSQSRQAASCPAPHTPDRRGDEQLLVGSFARENDRLVIRVNKMTYGGHDVGVDGIVIAPDTMEAGVASSVDQHYVARFALPAAAAFVQGLGQAIAQSNSTVVASPFGGATAFQRLNLGQQAGVGAGAAAARVGQALDQAAPRGATVKLDAKSSVGVMFLSDVTVPD